MAVNSSIILNKYSWTKKEFVCVAGFIWLNNKYMSGNGFADYIKTNSSDFDRFKKTVECLNGQFSIVVEHESEIWLAASHTWSFPVFYKSTASKIVSDNPDEIIHGFDVVMDSFSVIYFQVFGVTPTSKTLIKGISQIQPGEILRIRKDKIETSSVLSFDNEKEVKKDSVSEKELEKVLLQSFEKYFNHIKNNQVLLPLTRGYDSRLLACLLKEFGHNNVICATWGRSTSYEIETAKRVAKNLGYKHIFVDYSKVVSKDFPKSADFKSYIDFAAHYSSMPFLYEYFGVKELIREKVFDKSTIVLPGHPGDFIRGDHIGWDIVNGDQNYLASKIFSKFGTTFPTNRKENQKLKQFIIEEFFNDNESLKQGYKLWDYKERQCKFIGNSSQVFSFFGLECLMPLFDMEIIKFFDRLNDAQKIDQNLYQSTLEKLFFKKNNVDFDLKSPGKTKGSTVFKAHILKLIPHSIKTLYYPMDDIIYYREITGELQNTNKKSQFKHPVRPNAYNSYIIQWYLFSLQDNFQKN